MVSTAPAGKLLRILIAGGGTGGHVIPGLAIARELRDKHSAEVRFVGTARGLETRLVPENGFALALVRSGQLKNVSLATRTRTLLDLPLGVVACIRLIRSFRPHVVIGVGGYASGPGMLAAVLLRIPTLAYEPNAVPGMTNRWIGRFVSAAAVNFEATTRYFRNAHVTGVPVRSEIFAVPPRPSGEPLRLLVTAGSNGAQIFNQMVPRIAAQLFSQVPDLSIVHQSGSRQLDETLNAYAESGADPARYTVAAFLDDMPAQYAAADLILARAGSTIAELCAAGRPSVLVPLPTAADDHQRRNAEELVRAGAATMLLQPELTAATLADTLHALLCSPEKLKAMSCAAKTLARPEALERIAGLVTGLAQPLGDM